MSPGSPAAPGVVRGAGLRLELFVQDHRHVIAEDWPRSAELTRRDWGLTDFRVVDPDGYYWRVTSRA